MDENTQQTPEQATPAQAPEVTEATPQPQAPHPRRMVLMDQAQVEFLGADGTVEKTLTPLRGLTQLAACIKGELGDNPDEAQLQRKIRVTLFKVDAQPADPEAVEAVEETVEGTAGAMLAHMASNTMSAEMIALAVQRNLEKIGEVSDIKAALVTLIVGDERVGGFGYQNSLVPVDESAMVALAEAATVQVEVLKTYLKRQNPKVAFADDKPDSKIVTPRGNLPLGAIIPQGGGIIMPPGR